MPEHETITVFVDPLRALVRTSVQAAGELAEAVATLKEQSQLPRDWSKQETESSFSQHIGRFISSVPHRLRVVVRRPLSGELSIVTPARFGSGDIVLIAGHPQKLPEEMFEIPIGSVVGPGYANYFDWDPYHYVEYLKSNPLSTPWPSDAGYFHESELVYLGEPGLALLEPPERQVFDELRLYRGGSS